MKKIILFLLVFAMSFSCSELVDKPKKVIDEKNMAYIIADLIIKENLSLIAPKVNMSDEVKFTLKKYKTNADVFSESYKYYIATGRIEKIYDKAEDLIFEKDPKAKKYIQDKLKQQTEVR